MGKKMDKSAAHSHPDRGAAHRIGRVAVEKRQHATIGIGITRMAVGAHYDMLLQQNQSDHQ